jgi:hypothetical protein
MDLDRPEAKLIVRDGKPMWRFEKNGIIVEHPQRDVAWLTWLCKTQPPAKGEFPAA